MKREERFGKRETLGSEFGTSVEGQKVKYYGTEGVLYSSFISTVYSSFSTKNHYTTDQQYCEFICIKSNDVT